MVTGKFPIQYWLGRKTWPQTSFLTPSPGLASYSNYITKELKCKTNYLLKKQTDEYHKQWVTVKIIIIVLLF